MSTIVKADASGAVTLPAELCRAAGVEPGADLVAEVRTAASCSPRGCLSGKNRRPGGGYPPRRIRQIAAEVAAQIDQYLYGHPKRPE